MVDKRVTRQELLDRLIERDKRIYQLELELDKIRNESRPAPADLKSPQVASDYPILRTMRKNLLKTIRFFADGWKMIADRTSR